MGLFGDIGNGMAEAGDHEAVKQDLRKQERWRDRNKQQASYEKGRNVFQIVPVHPARTVDIVVDFKLGLLGVFIEWACLDILWVDHTGIAFQHPVNGHPALAHDFQNHEGGSNEVGGKNWIFECVRAHNGSIRAREIAALLTGYTEPVDSNNHFLGERWGAEMQRADLLGRFGYIGYSLGRKESEMAKMDFWYSIGSTYSYLTVMRLTEVAQASNVTVKWRPFNVRHVMVAQNNIPFKDKPMKSAYMWRDIERRAMRYGLNPSFPVPYPLAGLERANLVAILGAKDGWLEDYTKATYRLWFEQGMPAGEEPNLSQSLVEIGQNPKQVLEAAEGDQIVQALAEETEQAMALGIFGSPSFVVDGEVFWGDDRLEDALDWAKRS